jgi:hypothetical protein
MQCPSCDVLTLGKVVCPVCGCNFLKFRARRSARTEAPRLSGWGVGLSGRIVLIVALWWSLGALRAASGSDPAPVVLAWGLSGAVAGMLMVIIGHYLTSYRNRAPFFAGPDGDMSDECRPRSR